MVQQVHIVLIMQKSVCEQLDLALHSWIMLSPSARSDRVQADSETGARLQAHQNPWHSTHWTEVVLIAKQDVKDAGICSQVCWLES